MPTCCEPCPGKTNAITRARLRAAPSVRSSCSIVPLTPLAWKDAAVRIPASIASAPDLPWPITQQPLRPRSGAPPISSGSLRRLTAAKAGCSSSAPSRPRIPRGMASFSRSKTSSAAVSDAFSTTLPVKPSITTTSTLPLKRSCPSTLPTKLRLDCFSTSCASRTSSLPLVSSSPTLMRPDARPGDAQHAARVGAAHHPELLELARRALGVGADVDQDAAPLARRHHGRERGPVDVLERPEHAAGDRPAGGGVAGGEERVRPPVAHPLEPDLDRGALLERRQAHLLRHADRVGRVHDLDLWLGRSAGGDRVAEHALGPDERHDDPVTAARPQGALHHYRKAVVAADGVDGHARGRGAQASSPPATALPL